MVMADIREGHWTYTTDAKATKAGHWNDPPVLK